MLTRLRRPASDDQAIKNRLNAGFFYGWKLGD